MTSKKRVVTYIPEDHHKILKSKLALLGENVSSWFRKLIKEFIEE